MFKRSFSLILTLIAGVFVWISVNAVELTLALAGTVRSADGFPLSGVTVTYTPEGMPPVTVTTDENGLFDISPPIGTTVTFERDGYITKRSFWDQQPTTTIAIFMKPVGDQFCEAEPDTCDALDTLLDLKLGWKTTVDLSQDPDPETPTLDGISNYYALFGFIVLQFAPQFAPDLMPGGPRKVRGLKTDDNFYLYSHWQEVGFSLGIDLKNQLVLASGAQYGQSVVDVASVDQALQTLSIGNLFYPGIQQNCSSRGQPLFGFLLNYQESFFNSSQELVEESIFSETISSEGRAETVREQGGNTFLSMFEAQDDFGSINEPGSFVYRSTESTSFFANGNAEAYATRITVFDKPQLAGRSGRVCRLDTSYIDWNLGTSTTAFTDPNFSDQVDTLPIGPTLVFQTRTNKPVSTGSGTIFVDQETLIDLDGITVTDVIAGTDGIINGEAFINRRYSVASYDWTSLFFADIDPDGEENPLGVDAKLRAFTQAFIPGF